MKYALTIAYDGTHYSGWQIQPGAISIQETIQNALQTILREKVSLVGSGRTDAGVHALEQVAHFSTEKVLDCRKISYALNCILPEDIRILQMKNVPDDFHAIYSAKKKIYRYYICNEKVFPPFLTKYCKHIPWELDLEILNKACKHFIGTHDFTAFANEAHKGAAAKNPIKTIYRIDLVPQKDHFYLELEGSSFLYKMVRNMVGTLIDIASGKRPIEDIEKTLKSKDRKNASQALSGKGLFLVKVQY